MNGHTHTHTGIHKKHLWSIISCAVWHKTKRRRSELRLTATCLLSHTWKRQIYKTARGLLRINTREVHARKILAATKISFLYMQELYFLRYATPRELNEFRRPFKWAFGLSRYKIQKKVKNYYTNFHVLCTFTLISTEACWMRWYNITATYFPATMILISLTHRNSQRKTYHSPWWWK